MQINLYWIHCSILSTMRTRRPRTGALTQTYYVITVFENHKKVSFYGRLWDTFWVWKKCLQIRLTEHEKRLCEVSRCFLNRYVFWRLFKSFDTRTFDFQIEDGKCTWQLRICIYCWRHLFLPKLSWVINLSHGLQILERIDWQLQILVALENEKNSKWFNSISDLERSFWLLWKCQKCVQNSRICGHLWIHSNAKSTKRSDLLSSRKWTFEFITFTVAKCFGFWQFLRIQNSIYHRLQKWKESNCGVFIEPKPKEDQLQCHR